jgi:hypothetical protein
MDERIEPHKVTKPIQLLAAWLLGLIVVDASFLSAAAVLKQPGWVPIVLVIAAVCNVPLFLGSLFLLQTRYRPEMQEDSFYAKYLEVQKATGKPESVVADIQVLRATVAQSSAHTIEVVEELQTQVIRLNEQVSKIDSPSQESLAIGPAVQSIAEALEIGRDGIQDVKHEIRWQAYRVEINDLLPQYQDILSRLKKAGIPISDTFGTTSSYPRQPGLYLVVFGPNIDVEALQQLLLAIADTGPQYLAFGDDEEGDYRRFYVGSYSYENPLRAAKLDPAVLQQIQDSTSIDAVHDLIRRSPFRVKSNAERDTVLGIDG